MSRPVWLALLAMLAAPVQAESPDCLADLAGTLGQEGNQAPAELLVRRIQGNWQFSLPGNDDDGNARERMFRYHFDSRPKLDAQIIDAKQLPQLGAMMFSQFAERAADLKGLRTECGLTADGIFLLRVDLSQAQPQLINNMLTLNAALRGQGKKSPKKFGDPEITAARHLKYFAGEYFALEGVTSGIVSYPMLKRADAPQAARPTPQSRR